MNRNIKELAGFIAYFIFVMFLPVFVFWLLAPFTGDLSDLNSWGDLPIIFLFLPGFFKTQWLLILIPIRKILKTTANPLLINWFTNPKLNLVILLFGFVFDICVSCYLWKSGVLGFILVLFYWLLLAFSYNYIAIYAHALWHSKRRINILKPTNISGDIMDKYKNGLLYFILYFVFVMIFPTFVAPIFIVIGDPEPMGGFWNAIGYLLFAIFAPLALKIQILMLFIPTLIIRIKSKNPLLLRLLTDIKLNNKIFGIGFCFDLVISLLIFTILHITQNQYNIDTYLLTYWEFLSFTVNYIVIYLFAFIHFIATLGKKSEFEE